MPMLLQGQLVFLSYILNGNLMPHGLWRPRESEHVAELQAPVVGPGEALLPGPVEATGGASFPSGGARLWSSSVLCARRGEENCLGYGQTLPAARNNPEGKWWAKQKWKACLREQVPLSSCPLSRGSCQPENQEM